MATTELKRLEVWSQVIFFLSLELQCAYILGAEDTHVNSTQTKGQTNNSIQGATIFLTTHHSHLIVWTSFVWHYIS